LIAKAARQAGDVGGFFGAQAGRRILAAHTAYRLASDVSADLRPHLINKRLIRIAAGRIHADKFVQSLTGSQCFFNLD